jgi:hypothetical protein
VSRARSAALLLSAQCAAPAFAQEASADAFTTAFRHEFSAVAMFRVTGRDPGLIGGGNGGTGTSVNFDDGNLNYGRGWRVLGVQGRSRFEGSSPAAEFKVEAVYFYDFIAATEPDSPAAQRRGSRSRGTQPLPERGLCRVQGPLSDAAFGLRIGNEIQRWSDSRAFGYSIAPVNPVSGSRRYQAGTRFPSGCVRRASHALRKDRDRGEVAPRGFYLFDFKPSELDALGTFLGGNDFYSPGARYLQLGKGSPLVPDNDGSVSHAGDALRLACAALRRSRAGR